LVLASLVRLGCRHVHPLLALLAAALVAGIFEGALAPI
jgi:hypothetical protein